MEGGTVEFLLVFLLDQTTSTEQLACLSFAFLRIFASSW